MSPLSFQLNTSSIIAACIFLIISFPSFLYLSSICSISRNEHAYLCVCCCAWERTRDGIDRREKANKKSMTASARIYGRVSRLYLYYLLYIYIIFYCWMKTMSSFFGVTLLIHIRKFTFNCSLCMLFNSKRISISHK